MVGPWLPWVTAECDDPASADRGSFLCRLYADGRNMSRSLLANSEQSDRAHLQHLIDMMASSNSSQLLQTILVGLAELATGVYFGESEVLVHVPLPEPVDSLLTALPYIGHSSWPYVRHTDSRQKDAEDKPNKIKFTPYFMTTIHEQSISLPAFHCEYKLAVAGGTVLSISGMGTADASLTLTYDQNTLRVFLRNGHVYLGQNLIPSAIFFNLGDFVVKKSARTLLVETADVQLMIYFLKVPFSLMAFNTNMTGIAGRSYSSGHPTIHELLYSFSRFRLDRTCIDYYQPHHCRNNELCEGPGHIHEFSHDQSQEMGNSVSFDSFTTFPPPKQLGYVMLVDPFTMITTAQSEVVLPSFECEYELAQVNTTNVTIGYIGSDEAYIKFQVGKNYILVLISKNEIYLNGLYYPNDPAHVELPDLHMQRSGPHVRVMSYQVHWRMQFMDRTYDDHLPHTWSKIFCYQWPMGIGGESYPDGSSFQYVLERFEKHKCNPLCNESQFSSLSEISARVFGRGVLGSVPFFTPDMISSAAARFIDRHSLSLVEVDQHKMITYEQTVVPWPTLRCEYTLSQIREEIVSVQYLNMTKMRIIFEDPFLSLRIVVHFKDFFVLVNRHVITGNVSQTFGTTSVVRQENSDATGLMIEGKSLFVYVLNDTATEGKIFAKVFAKSQPEGIGYIFYGDLVTPDLLLLEFRRYLRGLRHNGC